MRLLRNILLACSLLAGTFPAFADPVDINHADVAAIAAAMKGVGLKKAEAIVAYRNRHGAFKKVDDLARVKGIGAGTVAANRRNIRVGKTTDGK